MRHTKAQKFNGEPLVSMPEKEEDVIFVDFTSKEKEYYDKLYKIAKERFESFRATGNIGRGTLSILSSLHPARQACSGFIYSKDQIEEELSAAEAKTYHIQEMMRADRNQNKKLSIKEKFGLTCKEVFDFENECPICYEVPMDEPMQTPCKHTFCGDCIRSILENKPECPICRNNVNVNQLTLTEKNNE